MSSMLEQSITIDDMKVAKFKLMYERIGEYLNPGGLSTIHIPIYIFPVGHYSNAFIVSIEQRLVTNAGWFVPAWINNGKAPLDKYVLALQYHSRPENFYEKGRILFWHLMLLAIDDEIYNNEIANVIDLAYNLRFHESMIKDWCRAVEYVLAGNELKEDCDLQCETEEGRQFFLHQE